MGKKDGKLKAAIDIGSNTALLLVGQVKDEKVYGIYEEQQTPRLGKGVDADKNLAEDSILKVIEALQAFKQILSEKFPHVKDVIVTATSAVRDAANKQYFIQRVHKETGFSVKILSGEEEAGYTYFGAKSVLDDLSGASCVLDIGGGSTEVALGNKRILKDRHSYDIGSVRFTERYLFDDPPVAAQVTKCRSAINESLRNKIFYLPPNVSLVGVAGTVTSLAHLQAGFESYNPDKINGNILNVEAVSRWISTIENKNSKQLLAAHPKILSGRADVILGGLLILECFMKSTRLTEVIVSTGGIRHGALLMNEQ